MQNSNTYQGQPQDLPHYESGFAPREKGELFYEMAGEGSFLVFTYNSQMPFDRRIWDHQFAFFAQRYRVLRFDFPGAGKSPAPKYRYDPQEEMLHLLQFLHVDHASLIDFGGEAALPFVHAHVELINALILVAPDVPRMPLTFRNASQAIQRTGGVRRTMKEVVEGTSKIMGFVQALRQKDEDALVTTSMQTWSIEPSSPIYSWLSTILRENMQTRTHASRQTSFSQGRSLLPSYLIDMHIPLLCVQSADYPSWDDLDQQQLPPYQLCLLPQTHFFPQAENIVEFNQCVLTFLQSL